MCLLLFVGWCVVVVVVVLLLLLVLLVVVIVVVVGLAWLGLVVLCGC